ncbi:XRE family transcriptional regulator [uncultured Bacteroides sp.]|uniref:helix-turn-helix domain-containing protein n=1 Tax=uncultured Bacteroides sp. TaxID=162156 RepID=UPI002AA7A5D5|nr:XRE family transcriptional regulator [uncultured Bacteroides sp.]
MNRDQINCVGKRIKEIRLSKEQKLVDIAIASGISKGLLSRVENGRTIPSLPVLFNIIAALKESPSAFFENIEYVTNSPFYLLIEKGNYTPIEKEESVGFNYFNIMSQSFKDITFNAVFLNLEPQAKREMVTTDGMEFIYLIEGDIDYRLNDVILSLKQGDSLFFDGRVPHLKINKSGKNAQILVIYLLFN